MKRGNTLIAGVFITWIVWNIFSKSDHFKRATKAVFNKSGTPFLYRDNGTSAL